MIRRMTVIIRIVGIISAAVSSVAVVVPVGIISVSRSEDQTDKKDQDHHKDDESDDRRKHIVSAVSFRFRIRCRCSVILVRSGRRASCQRNIVVITQPVLERVKDMLCSDGIIACHEVIIQIIHHYVRDRAGGQRSFQSRALQAVRILVSDAHYDEDAVVELCVSDAPVIEDLVAEILKVPVYEVYGHYDDLGAGLLAESRTVLHDVVLDIAVDNVRKVGYIYFRGRLVLGGHRGHGGNKDQKCDQYRIDLFHVFSPFNRQTARAALRMPASM